MYRYVLTRRRSWDEVEQTLCLRVDRAASRGDESAKGVSAGVVGETIFVGFHVTLSLDTESYDVR
jgi:hypothetical protein